MLGDGELRNEFAAADLGDRRRTHRLLQMVTTLGRDPSLSFPKAMGTDAALEGTYRLLNNPAVTANNVLEPHHRATVERVAQATAVVVAHDTTSVSFNGEGTRSGLGPLTNGGQGLFAHVSLAVMPDSRLPLGVMALRTWVRTGKKPKKRPSNRGLDPDRESKRWFDQVAVVESRMPKAKRAIHVMDREGDTYELLSQMSEHHFGFVVRSAHDRRVLGEHGHLSEVVLAAEFVCERQVPLCRRARSKSPKTRKIHPPRNTRIARLAFCASHIEFERPRYALRTYPERISVNVVHVRELDVSEGEKAVEWTLFTTEPICTAEEILRVVDLYRSRWTIEEFFKALKTGCSFEERQLESRHALENALAIFLPIAWRLLTLRSLSRANPDAQADLALTTTQLEVLRAMATRTKRNLSPAPTIEEALLAIAALGGHIKNNGTPGWQVLARGYHDLLLLELGWLAARPKDAINH